MTLYECDRCGKQVKEKGLINQVTIAIWGAPEKCAPGGDLCDACLASLKYFFEPLPREMEVRA